MVENLEYIIETLRKHNPNVQIILAATPVPLPKTWRTDLGPYIANEQSKSVILAAEHEIIGRFDGVQYFPVYEIVRNDPVRHTHPDGRHVATASYDYIMRVFSKFYKK